MEESFDSGSAFFNDTLTCAARNQGPVEVSFNPILPLVARCFLVIYFLMIAFFGTALNCFVFYLICRYKVLHTISFAFAIQNIALNIFGSVVLVTLSFVNVLANQWLLGEYLCIAVGALHLSMNILRNAFLIGLVTDRFCSVFFAYSYPRYQVRVLWCFSIASYIITAIVAVVPGVFDCYTFSITSWICRVSSTCSPQCAIIRQLNGFFIFLPAGVVPMIMYSALYCKGRKARKSMRALASCSASESHSEKKDNRATITFFLMFLSLFIAGTPPGLISAVLNITGLATNSTQSAWFYIVDALSLNMFIISHLADPIFILRNKDVRELINEINFIPFLTVKPKRPH